jgi:hypothetical protein
MILFLTALYRRLIWFEKAIQWFPLCNQIHKMYLPFIYNCQQNRNKAPLRMQEQEYPYYIFSGTLFLIFCLYPTVKAQ